MVAQEKEKQGKNNKLGAMSLRGLVFLGSLLGKVLSGVWLSFGNVWNFISLLWRNRLVRYIGRVIKIGGYRFYLWAKKRGRGIQKSMIHGFLAIIPTKASERRLSLVLYLIQDFDPDYRKATKADDVHNDLSKNISRTTIALFVFCLFCVTSITAQDHVIVARNASIKLPFANVDIPFVVFLIAGPIVLISIFSFLHLLVGEWYRIGGRFRKNALPFVFNLDRTLPRILTALSWYVVTPFVLLLFAYRSLPRDWQFYFVLILAIIVSVVLFIRANRRESRVLKDRRRRINNRQILWYGSFYRLSKLFLFLIILTVAGLVYMRIVDDSVFRRLYLVRADLSYQDISGANLNSADVRKGCLKGVDLTESDLRGANLSSANLSNSDLVNTNFSNSDLTLADLRGANIKNTKFDDANLAGANLIGVRGGSAEEICKQLRKGRNWIASHREEALSCGEPIFTLAFKATDSCDASR